MSIVVKGAKLPNNCGACPLRLAWCTERIYMVTRPERCPLEPERTGKWIHGRELAREMISDCIVAIRYDGWKCSECNCLVEQEREPLYNFCPNCGARMEQ